MNHLTAKTWSIERVKVQLPPVRIMGKRTSTSTEATLSGRMNRFATVTDVNSGASYEVAWSTVARCLNRDYAIKI